MKILSIGVLFLGITIINQSVLVGIGAPKEITKAVLIAATVNIILNFILIPLNLTFFGIEMGGINGAAIATTSSYFLVLLITSLKIRNKIGAKLNLKIWIKIFLATLIFIFVANILRNLINTNQYIEAIISFVVAGFVYLISCYLMKVISIKELKFFFNKIMNRNLHDVEDP